MVEAVNDAGAQSPLTAYVSAMPAVTLFSDTFESGNLTAGGWTVSGATAQTEAAYSGSYGARTRNSGAYIRKSISTVGYNTIHYKYAIRTKNLDAGEYVSVQWSTNGTSWTTIETISVNDTWYVRDQALPAGANGQSTLYMRFINTCNGIVEDGNIDDVAITGVAS